MFIGLIRSDSGPILFIPRHPVYPVKETAPNGARRPKQELPGGALIEA
jgi:hypothetical protein